MPKQLIRLLIVISALTFVSSLLYVGLFSVLRFDRSDHDASINLSRYGLRLSQVSVVAMWTCCGPLTWMWRLLFASGWMLVRLGCDVFYWILKTRSVEEAIANTIGPTMDILEEWAIMIVPMCALCFLFDWQLRERTTIDAKSPVERSRFRRLWDVLIVFAIATTMFGIKGLFVRFTDDESRFPETYNLVLMLVTTAVTLPLLLAALADSFARVWVSMLIGLICIITVWEASLMNFLFDETSMLESFVWINAVAAIWSLVAALAIRACGYRLVAERSNRQMLTA